MVFYCKEEFSLITFTHSFTSMWTQRFLFYSMGCNPSLSLFMVIFWLPQIGSVSAHLTPMSGWHVYNILWTHLYFLASKTSSRLILYFLYLKISLFFQGALVPFSEERNSLFFKKKKVFLKQFHCLYGSSVQDFGNQSLLWFHSANGISPHWS